MQEARHLAALQHPNIVTVFDYIESDGDLLVVMELLQGRTMQEIAETAPLTPEDFVRAMEDILDGLVAAHEIGMLHRDIKPSNLMFVDRGSRSFQVKILDFGLAKVAAEPSLQTIDIGGGVLGSVFTMSPEQFEGRPLDPRSDLYSLGCVAYFSLTTFYPFRGASVTEVITGHLRHALAPLEELRPDVPVAVCRWVEHLMAVHPEDRPATAAEALDELIAAVGAPSLSSATVPVSLAPAAPAPKPPSPPGPLMAAQRKPLPSFAIPAAVLAVIVFVVALILWVSRPKPDSASLPAGNPAAPAAAAAAAPVTGS